MTKALPLLVLLLCLSAFAQTTTPDMPQASYQVAIRPYACYTVQNCMLFNADMGSGGEGSTDWIDVQPDSAMFLIFAYGYPNPGLECYGATATFNGPTMGASTTYIAKCSGTSSIDGTPYTLFQTVNFAYTKPPGYRFYRYLVSGGLMVVKASQATLHGLGIPGY